jgi:hypothetical protein
MRPFKLIIILNRTHALFVNFLDEQNLNGVIFALINCSIEHGCRKTTWTSELNNLISTHQLSSVAIFNGSDKMITYDAVNCRQALIN